MDSYPRAAVERAMKIQEVMLRAMAKRITWWQAAEIIGISDRSMRRWKERYEEHGYDGLFDRRRGRPSPKKVAVAEVQEVLGLYQERYYDFSVRHFHEKLAREHGIGWSYTWVKRALQGAGLVKKQSRRGVHRRRRPRRPLPGMLLHLDGSKHRWFGDDRWHDLLVVLDDATSEVYYAQLVEEESTRTVLAALRHVVEQRGVFCALYTDRASHFFETPKAGAKVDHATLTQVGRAMQELGVEMIPAYSPEARGRSERNFGTWQGRLPQELRLRGIRTVEEANRFLRETYIAEFTEQFRVSAAQRGTAFMPGTSAGTGPHLLHPAPAHRQSGQYRDARAARLADRKDPLAFHPGRLPGAGFRTPRRAALHSLRPARSGALSGGQPAEESGMKHGLWKKRAAGNRGKVQTADFSTVPTALGNPAHPAGFPLSHSPDRGCSSSQNSSNQNPKPDRSRANKTGQLDMLMTHRELAQCAASLVSEPSRQRRGQRGHVGDQQDARAENHDDGKHCPHHLGQRLLKA
jgi:transposase